MSLFDLKPDEVDLDAVYTKNVVEAGPTLKYHAHGDAIGSVALRPTHLSSSQHLGPDISKTLSHVCLRQSRQMRMKERTRHRS